MSKGPGRVGRRLHEIFTKEPDGIFTTKELCCLVYGLKRAQKKHRVAVLRALKNLAGGPMPRLWRKVSAHDRDDAWYDSEFYPGDAADRAPARAKRPRKR